VILLGVAAEGWTGTAGVLAAALVLLTGPLTRSRDLPARRAAAATADGRTLTPV
jgi:hypothetical protein